MSTSLMNLYHIHNLWFCCMTLPLIAGALEDFSAAIEAFPQYGDAWKRRGQAKVALGDLNGAQEVISKPKFVYLHLIFTMQ